MQGTLGAQCNVQLHPIITTAPFELLHVDYTSIEMTMELNLSPKVDNIPGFQDHSAKHVMVYVTPSQTTKTVAKFLCQGYILTSGALAKLLSNQGANFMSNIIQDLCEPMGIKKIRTLPYHTQTNGQVECAHQTIMWMIGKPSKDQKANWLNHLTTCQRWCKPTAPWDQLWRGIAHITPCLGNKQECQLASTSQPWGEHRGTRVLMNTSLTSGIIWERPARRPKTNPWWKSSNRSSTVIDGSMLFH